MSLVRLALGNVYGVVVFALFIAVLGSVALVSIPVDILPAFKVPAVQVLTYFNGMPARSIERNLEKLRVTGAKVVQRDVRQALATDSRTYDLVLCDPPYGYVDHERLASYLVKALAPDGLLVAGDLNGDGIPDELEQAMLKRFVPTFMVSAEDCDGLGGDPRFYVDGID
jgi:SAM-dependent methyltransferase